MARGNLAACLARPLDASIQRALCDETRRACPDALARLMADHTQARACNPVPAPLSILPCCVGDC